MAESDGQRVGMIGTGRMGGPRAKRLLQAGHGLVVFDTNEAAVRSLLNIAMISALNRPHELKLHVKGALTNGVSRDEIREVLMQVAIY